LKFLQNGDLQALCAAAESGRRVAPPLKAAGALRGSTTAKYAYAGINSNNALI
jgi:hypothetical protein